MKQHGIAQKVVAAGLGIAMALGSVAPTIALAESTGDTGLYVTAQDNDITTPEGAQDENIKVVIPVAISYVADTDGTLTGPSDGSVAIKNNASVGSVHVSKIQVTPETGVTLVESANAADENDETYLRITPGSGHYINLSEFQAEKAPRPDEWDIAQSSQLALNELTGKIGGFGAINPVTKSKLATVHWTVAGGSAAQAASAADRLLIHRVIPGGSLPDLVITSQSHNETLGAGYTWTNAEGSSLNGTSSVSGLLQNGIHEVTVYGTPMP
jgi:hypothetical protein